MIRWRALVPLALFAFELIKIEIRLAREYSKVKG